VYGRFSILPKRAVGIRTASLGLLAIFVSMLLLSMMRTRLKFRRLAGASSRDSHAMVHPANS
jgi:hypothetical protein